MFCGKCGKELREKAAFCASCGNPVNQTREVSVSGARPGPRNDPRRFKQTDYGLEKELSLWSVHKVKKPELYGGHSNRAYWLFGLLTIFLAWPVGLIVFLIDFKSKSAVRKCQARNLLITAGLGCILMLGVIVEQGNEGKKINNTGLIAADGTMHGRKEQDTRRTEDGFSFIGINWNDKPEMVTEKIRQSGYASGDHVTWWKEDNGSFHAAHFANILDDRFGEKAIFLFNIGGRWTGQLERSNDITVKQLSFTGKTNSIAKEGEFFFTYKTDILLSYIIRINNKIAHFDDTGKGGFYQSLVEKYGKPRKEEFRFKWSQKDHSLYYVPLISPLDGRHAELIYVSEKNLSAYVETIEEKRNALEAASSNKQTNAVRKDF